MKSYASQPKLILSYYNATSLSRKQIMCFFVMLYFITKEVWSQKKYLFDPWWRPYIRILIISMAEEFWIPEHVKFFTPCLSIHVETGLIIVPQEQDSKHLNAFHIICHIMSTFFFRILKMLRMLEVSQGIITQS